MKDGDYIVSINEQDVKWAPHDQVVSLIKKSGNSLKMKLVTPMDKIHAKEKVGENYTVELWKESRKKLHLKWRKKSFI